MNMSNVSDSAVLTPLASMATKMIRRQLTRSSYGAFSCAQ